MGTLRPRWAMWTRCWRGGVARSRRRRAERPVRSVPWSRALGAPVRRGARSWTRRPPRALESVGVVEPAGRCSGSRGPRLPSARVELAPDSSTIAAGAFQGSVHRTEHGVVRDGGEQALRVLDVGLVRSTTCR